MKVTQLWPAFLQPSGGWCPAGGGGPGEEAACWCEAVFILTQIVLSLGLPLLGTYLAERAQRRLFLRKATRRGRYVTISHRHLPLLLLLAAMMLRCYLALRFEAEQPLFAE